MILCHNTPFLHQHLALPSEDYILIASLLSKRLQNIAKLIITSQLATYMYCRYPFSSNTWWFRFNSPRGRWRGATRRRTMPSFLHRWTSSALSFSLRFLRYLVLFTCISFHRDRFHHLAGIKPWVLELQINHFTLKQRKSIKTCFSSII